MSAVRLPIHRRHRAVHCAILRPGRHSGRHVRAPRRRPGFSPDLVDRRRRSLVVGQGRLVVRPRLENTKEVAARVGHDYPSLVAGLPDVCTRSPELESLLHTGRLIFRSEIQVDRPLCDGAIRRLDKEGWPIFSDKLHRVAVVGRDSIAEKFTPETTDFPRAIGLHCDRGDPSGRHEPNLALGSPFTPVVPERRVPTTQRPVPIGKPVCGLSRRRIGALRTEEIELSSAHHSSGKLRRYALSCRAADAWVAEQLEERLDDPNFENEYRTWQANNPRTTFVVDLDGTLIGMLNLLVFERMPKPGKKSTCWVYLGNAFVAADRRNCGVGGALLDAAIQFSQDIKAARIVLSPSPESQTFYARRGFEPPEELLVKRFWYLS